MFFCVFLKCYFIIFFVVVYDNNRVSCRHIVCNRLKSDPPVYADGAEVKYRGGA